MLIKLCWQVCFMWQPYFVDGADELLMQVTTFEQGWGSKQMGCMQRSKKIP